MVDAAPPVIAGERLTKRFSSAVLAVDDFDFSVERGEICGLLGPNGAGKTTTLRMLLGLVHPTAGEARLFGEPVRPGTPLLRRVGAVIEQAAFVPHLSGMANLRLWWEVGGDRFENADLEGALAIADLGDAINRRVKTYSQGMRQRLGLARVMLGRPEVLVLDEPTNGLDPGEMREVRRLISRLAESGSTVLLSSHMLAEVEQVCTRVVVMDHGRLVMSGPVHELIAAAGVVYLEVDDPARARTVLDAYPGVRRVEPEGEGLAVNVGHDVRRADLVAALVAGGVGVETVTARRRLEDAFLDLLEETSR